MNRPKDEIDIGETLAPNGRQGEAKSRAATRIAHKVGVGERTVERVMVAVEKGAPELKEMMKNRELSARKAAEFAKLKSPAEQKEIIQNSGIDAVKDIVAKARKEEREAKESAEERKKSYGRALEFQPLKISDFVTGT